jgi:GNAT superfamily N-acetyltransferase
LTSSASTEPTIRRAQPEDRDEVNALVRAFHAEDGHPISQRGLTAVRVMLEPDSLQGSIMLLKAGEQPGGYGALCLGFSIEYEGREAFIDDLYILPALRGHGYGRLLFEALEREARSCGCSVIHLEVMPGNPVKRWYESLGYADRRSTLLTKRM